MIADLRQGKKERIDRWLRDRGVIVQRGSDVVGAAIERLSEVNKREAIFRLLRQLDLSQNLSSEPTDAFIDRACGILERIAELKNANEKTTS